MVVYFDYPFQAGVTIETEQNTSVIKFGAGYSQENITNPCPLRKITYRGTFPREEFVEVYELLEGLHMRQEPFEISNPVTMKRMTVVTSSVPKVTVEAKNIYTIEVEFREKR